jgi:hypothetical protein
MHCLRRRLWPKTCPVYGQVFGFGQGAFIEHT